ARDEVVVQTEAADRQVEERTLVPSLDIGGQNAGRGLCRAHSCVACIHHLHRRASTRELVGHCAADNAGADNNDIRGARRHHISAYPSDPGGIEPLSLSLTPTVEARILPLPPKP